jgi:hypothetical protein
MPHAMVTPPGVLISASGVVTASTIRNVLCVSWRMVSMTPFIARGALSPVQKAVTTPAAAFCSVSSTTGLAVAIVVNNKRPAPVSGRRRWLCMSTLRVQLCF